MGYHNCWDPIYRIGTREFRKRCCINTNKAISLQKDIDAVDEALKDKGISTEGFTPEDYKNAIEELSAEQYYGIEFDITDSSPLCTRIGDMQLHSTLPVHSKMRGCLLADDGTVVKYLNSSDWTSEVRDGSQGQVMVEVPEHWIRFETDGNKRRVYVSEREISSFMRVPKYYVSAYEAALDRTNNILCSVVNDTAQFRGGNNTSDWDGTGKSVLGKPVTGKNRGQMRIAARNRNSTDPRWNILTYDIYKDLFWLYYIEYANLNCQDTYTGERDANGYRQGGLGAGVTNISSADWSAFNGYYPFIPCGYTDSLGNSTGVVPFEMPAEFGKELTTYVPRWRGIENIFGHLWKHCDGMIIDVQSEEAGGESKFYVFDRPENYKDTIDEHAIYIGNQIRAEGYLKEVAFGDFGDIYATAVNGGASSTKYFCDYTYNLNLPTTGNSLRTLILGGTAHHGASAGLGCLHSDASVSDSSSHFGFRLCFISE